MNEELYEALTVLAVHCHDHPNCDNCCLYLKKTEDCIFMDQAPAGIDIEKIRKADV